MFFEGERQRFLRTTIAGDRFRLQVPCREGLLRRYPVLARQEIALLDVREEDPFAQAHPLWKWLKGEKPGLLGTQAIKWNFTKFLVGKDGRVIHRYAPQDAPKKLAGDIEAALAA